MKHLQTLNEYFYEDKHKYAKWVSKNVILALCKAGAFDHEEAQRQIANIRQDGGCALEVGDMDSEQLDRIIQPYKRSCLSKDQIILSYDYKDCSYKPWVDIYYKALHIHRVKPLPYVYHRTRAKNVESILVSGIQPSDSSDWTHRSNQLEYPPVVFANNVSSPADVHFFKDEPDYVTLRIAAASIPNKWFADLNTTILPQQASFISIRSDQTKCIMTFDAIPASAITVIN